MKILIYAFEPYKDHHSNISKDVLLKIPERKDLIKIVFPVKLDEQSILKEVRIKKPELIIGLGQHPAANKIRIERKAINLVGSKNEGYQPIEIRGPKFRYVNWKIKKDRISRISYDAGRYVCNFSIYVLAEWSKKNNVKFAFIHIPKKTNVKSAVYFVQSLIDESVRL